jgi:hypothetical protein
MSQTNLSAAAQESATDAILDIDLNVQAQTASFPASPSLE